MRPLTAWPTTSTAGRRIGPEASERHGKVRVPRTDDVFASAVCLLAGEAFERSIGLDYQPSRTDLEAEERVLATRCSGRALDQACRVVWESALELASSDRFHRLVSALVRS